MTGGYSKPYKDFTPPCQESWTPECRRGSSRRRVVPDRLETWDCLHLRRLMVSLVRPAVSHDFAGGAAHQLLPVATDCYVQPPGAWILDGRAIPFSTVTTVCCGHGQARRWRRLPQDTGRVHGLVRGGGCVRRLSGTAPLGRRVRVPRVRVDPVLAGESRGRCPGLRGVRQAHLGHGRHRVRTDTVAADPVVRGRLACVRNEERSERPRAADAARAGQLRDGLGVAAQAPPGHGHPWDGSCCRGRSRSTRPSSAAWIPARRAAGSARKPWSRWRSSPTGAGPAGCAWPG